MAELDRLFIKMVENKVSDIHLNSNSVPILIQKNIITEF